MKTEHFKYFSVPLFRVTCVLQNLPEVDVCKSFIPTVLLGTESFTKTAGWMGLETSWLIMYLWYNPQFIIQDKSIRVCTFTLGHFSGEAKRQKGHRVNYM